MNHEPVLAAAIASAVEAYPIRTVPLKDVLAAAAAVDRTAAASVDWRARVLTAINALAHEGRIELPKTRADRTALPAMPSYVRRPAPPKSEVLPKVPVVWHADLEWVALADNADQLGISERRFLTKVNAWLPKRRGVVVPLRERSLEMFNDEKELESWVLGPLFAPGRLTVELLECEPCWPPVEQRVLGSGDWLIIENYTTYVSIGRAASDNGFAGRIIWGSGMQVGTRLSALAASGERPLACWYFGDVDAGGFRAARLAVERADMVGLGQVKPARGLYRLALTHGKNRLAHSTSRAGRQLTEWIGSWLGAGLTEAATIAEAGKRIVQENVGVEVLAGVPLVHWFDG
ncbi:Wadjet anti-phage system protein JetD domain-containing protein [Kibdelosporangium aridum]|uniref:Wadjet anti-phage system protein JetD domain-containing protein n=1 Tax=Kibdelosporangium aridum TaxID=2030 RepID=UPI000524C167